MGAAHIVLLSTVQQDLIADHCQGREDTSMLPR